MDKRICVICGEEFMPKSSRRTMCYKEHFHPCPVCGKPTFTKDINHQNCCCSYECSRKKAAQSSIEYWNTHPEVVKAKQHKAEQTCMSKYGVKNPMGDPTIREKTINNTKQAIFERSGEISAKRKATVLERYGVEHCMQSSEIKQKVIDTNMKRYGVSCTLNVPEVNAKRKATLIEKYGTDNPMKVPEIKQKVRNTCIERYGTEFPAMCSPEINAKVQATMVERYGVPRPTLNADIKEKARQTHINTLADPEKRMSILQRTKATHEDRYGGFGLASVKLADKARCTMLSKYGTPYFSMSDYGKSKIQAATISKYGVSNYSQTEEGRQHIRAVAYNKMSPEMQLFRRDPIAYLESLSESQKTEPLIAERLGVTPSTISCYVCKNNLQQYVTISYSTMEDSICAMLSDWGIEYIRCTRSIIPPLELDIYIPSCNLAIECNPTSTHNSSFESPWGIAPKSYMYHKDKSIACRDKGIFLFHIFGYEWKNRPMVIRSMIRNLVGQTPIRIYGRDTKVVELDASDSAQFLNDNHRQGTTNASIRLGLVDKSSNVLYSVMTFNKVRSTIGDNGDDSDVMELSRFCNKINTIVVGAASKLFKYFIEHYQFDKVVSFSDIAHTRGNLYSKLGFKSVNESNPSYVWVNTKTDLYLNRVSCQKKNLPNLFPDVTDEIVANHTEKEIMMSHGFAQVFDSGTIRWEYTK